MSRPLHTPCGVSDAGVIMTNEVTKSVRACVTVGSVCKEVLDAAVSVHGGMSLVPGLEHSTFKFPDLWSSAESVLVAVEVVTVLGAVMWLTVDSIVHCEKSL